MASGGSSSQWGLPTQHGVGMKGQAGAPGKGHRTVGTAKSAQALPTTALGLLQLLLGRGLKPGPQERSVGIGKNKQTNKKPREGGLGRAGEGGQGQTEEWEVELSSWRSHQPHPQLSDLG